MIVKLTMICVEGRVGGKYVVIKHDDTELEVICDSSHEEHRQIVSHYYPAQEVTVLGGGRIKQDPFDDGTMLVCDSSQYYGAEPMEIRKEVAKALQDALGGCWLSLRPSI